MEYYSANSVIGIVIIFVTTAAISFSVIGLVAQQYIIRFILV